MPSLRELLAAHAPLLLIDAASTHVQTGWLPSENEQTWSSSDEEASTAIFETIGKLGNDVGAAKGFIFCHGPGSILGVRSVAMALRTWCVLKPRPIFAYTSLEVVAHALGRPELGVIADARRDSWHHFQLGAALRRVPTAQLSGEMVIPDGFRHWTTPPPNVRRTSYVLPELLPRIIDRPVFEKVEAPDAFLHEEPSYVTWTPQIHRAP